MNSTSPIYVDTLVPTVPNDRWPFKESCHLFTTPDHPDHLPALHAFAKALGLKRHWFQWSAAMPHYDLTKSKRAKALAAGASALDRSATVTIIRQWREHRSSCPPITTSP